jgi:hypothetical protein
MATFLLRSQYYMKHLQSYGLIHNCTFEALKFMKNKGLLMTEYDKTRKITTDQYPGIYMESIWKNSRGRKNVWIFGEIIIVFNKSLLLRTDFHYNRTDQNGNFNRYTYTSDYCLNKGFPVPIKGNGILKYIHEVVFHHSINVSHISEIWTNTRKVANKAKLLFPNIKIICTKKIPTRDIISNSTIIRPILPNYCYYADEYASENKRPIEHINFYKRNAMLYCNISNKVNLTSKTFKGLNKKLHKHIKKHYALIPS